MPFVKSGRTDLRAVSINPKEHVKKAQGYLRQAKHVGAMASSAYPGASVLQTKQEVKLITLAAEHFRIAGEQQWIHSAHAYAQAAAIASGAMMDSRQSAELYTEAAMVIEKLDTDFANEYYRKSISQHCDESQYKEAAILQDRMAFDHYQKKNIESSLVEYERATKLYSAADMNDRADETNDRIAYLLGKEGRVRESAFRYYRNAINQSNQNLKKFNVPQAMLRAGLLLLSDSLRQSSSEIDFSEVREMVEHAYDMDCRFEESREHAFLSDMMKCAIQGDQDRFADCVYWFSSVCEFDDLMLDALGGIKDVVTERSEKNKTT